MRDRCSLIFILKKKRNDARGLKLSLPHLTRRRGRGRMRRDFTR